MAVVIDHEPVRLAPWPSTPLLLLFVGAWAVASFVNGMLTTGVLAAGGMADPRTASEQWIVTATQMSVVIVATTMLWGVSWAAMGRTTLVLRGAVGALSRATGYVFGVAAIAIFFAGTLLPTGAGTTVVLVIAIGEVLACLAAYTVVHDRVIGHGGVAFLAATATIFAASAASEVMLAWVGGGV